MVSLNIRPHLPFIYCHHRSVEGLMFTYGKPVNECCVHRTGHAVSLGGPHFLSPLSLLELPNLASDCLLLLRCMIVSSFCASYCALKLDVVAANDIM